MLSCSGPNILLNDPGFMKDRTLTIIWHASFLGLVPWQQKPCMVLKRGHEPGKLFQGSKLELKAQRERNVQKGRKDTPTVTGHDGLLLLCCHEASCPNCANRVEDTAGVVRTSQFLPRSKVFTQCQVQTQEEKLNRAEIS